MEGLIGLIFWAVIISKIVKAVKGDKKPSRQGNVQRQQVQQRQTMQQRPVRKTTQAQRDAYYYSQQKATKDRLQQK